MPVPKGLGAPLPLDAAALDQQATVTPTDVKAAMALWNRLCPPAFRGLLDAQGVEPDA